MTAYLMRSPQSPTSLEEESWAEMEYKATSPKKQTNKQQKHNQYNPIEAILPL